MASQVSRALHKPKLLYQVVIDRKHYPRRLRLLFILILVSGLAWVAMDQARDRQLADGLLLNIGSLAAAAILILASVRFIITFVRWRRRPNETLRFFNRGFSWTHRGETSQYPWSKIHTLREGDYGIYLGKRPLIQWGSHSLLMSDQRSFKITTRHGDLRLIGKIIRPYVAEVTGTRMGRRLRDEKPIRIHPKLTVWPGGLQIGKAEYPWEDLNVRLKGDQLLIQARVNGKTRRVGRFNRRSIDNLGGFLDLAQVTIRTHRGNQARSSVTRS
jgi:hypothetical protein